jgi:lycopene cyclase domain-containing protein
MTYAMFLVVFLVIPIAVLVWLLRRSLRRRQIVWIGLLMGIALIYTTPWDNYLVANRVWWYQPQLVTGLTIGWVPIEEYAFFLLQPLMSGLWFLLMDRSLPNVAPAIERPRFRLMYVIGAGVFWLAALILLVAGWVPGTYLALMLVWGLPPAMLQLGAGADILWQRRRSVLFALLPATIYLAAADALAINGGTWTIEPAHSLSVMIGGVLPLEELLFFLLTNTLVVFAMTLLSEASMRSRVQVVFSYLRARLTRRMGHVPAASHRPSPNALMEKSHKMGRL